MNRIMIDVNKLQKLSSLIGPFRLFIRGIDDEGRVANYVESEQILQLTDVACSYVQVCWHVCS